LLNLVERRPLALWQRKGRFSLIDQKGVVILDEGLERYSDLLVVVGEEAPTHASRLLEILSTQPRLMPMVRAAVWGGGRRWNVRMVGNIDVRLPEKDPTRAWARLAEYDRTHRVLERDVQVLDLRFPDRLIVRKPPPAEKPAVDPKLAAKWKRRWTKASNKLAKAGYKLAALLRLGNGTGVIVIAPRVALALIVFEVRMTSRHKKKIKKELTYIKELEGI
ncbi:MAG: cell division protein FtsQ, partial [Bacteroidetes bacterium]|nr:cell division protein FtsQ [Bacteroidota bacterium]